MKKLCLIIIILMCALFSKARPLITTDSLCNFLENLQFKNGVDTIVVKVRYQSFFRSPDYRALKQLDKEKKIKYSDFGDITSGIDNSLAISFFPESCSTLYSATLKKGIDTNFISQLKRDDVVYLTCVVFSDDNFNRPDIIKNQKFYFLILKISTTR